MNLRKLHRQAASFIFIPLLLTALTGVAYRIGRSWFGLSDEFGEFMMVIHQGEILLTIHQGAYLGATFKPIYVLLVGVSLAIMLATGIQMSGIFRKRRPQTTEND
jgi:hypothetical protein